MSVETQQLSLDTLQQDLGLEYEAIFVPWSKSRHAVKTPKLSDYNLNWVIRIRRANTSRWLIETDYMQGIAHIPGYKAPRLFIEEKELMFACEEGRLGEWSDGMNDVRAFVPSRRIPAPAFKDVMYCLVMDSDVLDYRNFEDWASCFGYDTDSRKAEGIYRACLEIALALRNVLGDVTLSQLKELYADY